MNLPNKITLTRIFMIPVFVVFFYLNVMDGWNYLVSAIVFVLAAATDAIDGHIARSRHLVTDLGKFLDPIADKVLVSTALILLLTQDSVFTVSFFEGWGYIAAAICVAVILARELIVSGFRMVAAGKGVVLAADKLGKLKTTFQDIAIALLLASITILGISSEAGEIVALIGLVCFYVCTLLTILSGVNYIVKNKQVLAEDKPQEAQA